VKQEVEEIKMIFPKTKATKKIWSKIKRLTCIENHAENDEENTKNPLDLEKGNFRLITLNFNVTNLHRNEA
jgi:hypothetical protein